jgi:hypothetical protein
MSQQPMKPENDNALSFLDLATEVILHEKKALTSDEIWDYAQTNGLIARLRSRGKTPSASLGALLYVSVKKPDSPFVKVGARPARFFLKELSPGVQPTPQIDQPAPRSSQRARNYAERDLHPLLVRFASDTFLAHSKTIYHEHSMRRGEKQNQWLHPDITGFSLSSGDWEPTVVQLAQSTSSSAARLYSFELKIELEFSTLREYFFQAVSNSSWAHEGYLVAAQIDEDPEFIAELKRLSQSFGIGVVQLDVDEPIDSTILFPAERRPVVDWETMNRIAAINPDFADFVRAVANSVRINEPAVNGFDTVLEDDAMAAYVRKIIGGPVVSFERQSA